MNARARVTTNAGWIPWPRDEVCVVVLQSHGVVYRIFMYVS